MKKKLVITLTIICIIAGGYIAMKYVEKKTRRAVLEETRSTSGKVHSL